MMAFVDQCSAHVAVAVLSLASTSLGFALLAFPNSKRHGWGALSVCLLLLTVLLWFSPAEGFVSQSSSSLALLVWWATACAPLLVAALRSAVYGAKAQTKDSTWTTVAVCGLSMFAGILNVWWFNGMVQAAN